MLKSNQERYRKDRFFRGKAGVFKNNSFFFFFSKARGREAHTVRSETHGGEDCAAVHFTHLFVTRKTLSSSFLSSVCHCISSSYLAAADFVVVCAIMPRRPGGVIGSGNPSDYAERNPLHGHARVPHRMSDGHTTGAGGSIPYHRGVPHNFDLRISIESMFEQGLSNAAVAASCALSDRTIRRCR